MKICAGGITKAQGAAQLLKPVHFHFQVLSGKKKCFQLRYEMCPRKLSHSSTNNTLGKALYS